MSVNSERQPADEWSEMQSSSRKTHTLNCKQGVRLSLLPKYMAKCTKAEWLWSVSGKAMPERSTKTACYVDLYQVHHSGYQNYRIDNALNNVVRARHLGMASQLEGALAEAGHAFVWMSDLNLVYHEEEREMSTSVQPVRIRKIDT